jgi:hypothetical protein
MFAWVRAHERQWHLSHGKPSPPPVEVAEWPAQKELESNESAAR